MRAYIVVDESTEDESTNSKIVARLLPSEIRSEIAVVPVGPRSTVVSVARTLLATRYKPLAVLINTKTVDEPSVEIRQEGVEDLVQAAAAGVPFKVLMMVPEFEVLLFKVPEALERVSGQKLSVEDVIVARYQPHKVIQQLGKDDAGFVERVVNELTEEELNVIRESSPINELIDFLTAKVAPTPQLV